MAIEKQQHRTLFPPLDKELVKDSELALYHQAVEKLLIAEKCFINNEYHDGRAAVRLAQELIQQLILNIDGFQMYHLFSSENMSFNALRQVVLIDAVQDVEIFSKVNSILNQLRTNWRENANA